MQKPAEVKLSTAVNQDVKPEIKTWPLRSATQTSLFSNILDAEDKLHSLLAQVTPQPSSSVRIHHTSIIAYYKLSRLYVEVTESGPLLDIYIFKCLEEHMHPVMRQAQRWHPLLAILDHDVESIKLLLELKKK